MGLYSEYTGLADATDLELAAQRQSKRDVLEAINNHFNPLCGDVVIFPTGVRLRISYVWTEEGRPRGIQTSDEGRWYWSATGNMDFSGTLRDSIPATTLTDTGEHEGVPAWFFHHDRASAHRSVGVTAHVRVWTTTAAVP
jgi:hypothetical protein